MDIRKYLLPKNNAVDVLPAAGYSQATTSTNNHEELFSVVPTKLNNAVDVLPADGDSQETTSTNNHEELFSVVPTKLLLLPEKPLKPADVTIIPKQVLKSRTLPFQAKWFSAYL